jgi:hypothetical protein
LDELCYVFSENFNLILGYTCWLIAEVVSSHIRGDDMIVLAYDRYLTPPSIPELRKAMQQDDEITATFLNIVKADTVYFDEVRSHNEVL